jgi:hypothetical protein
VTKISQLSSIGDSLAIGDQFLIRDIDDAGSPNKSVTVSGITRALADGNATAPALAFAADKNTGIYRVGTDSLAVATNGAGRLFVDANGFVGIGAVNTGSTGAQLSTTTTSSTARLIVESTNAAGYTGLRVANGTGHWEMQVDGANQGLRWLDDGSERLRIDSSGRFLVGTSTGVAIGAGSEALIQGAVSTGFNLALYSTINSSGAGGIAIGKSRNGAVVQNNDDLGSIVFAGHDGTDYQTRSASIAAFVDGTPGANDMPGRLTFSTTADGASSPTERMRIDSSGNTAINQTSTSYHNGYATAFRTSNGSWIINHPNTITTGTFVEFGRYDNGTIGSITHTNTSSVSYNTSSDYRLKENVTVVTDGITRLQQLKPSRFNFIADPGHTVDGFLAHEVQDIVPEAITGTKDAVDDGGNPVYQGIDQSKLVPLLTAALQEAIGRIETLEAEVSALKGA